MKIFNSNQLLILDTATLAAHNITLQELIQRAANAFVNVFTQKVKKGTSVFTFCGPGNNGADGLAISWALLQKGYLVNTYITKLEATSPAFTSFKIRLNHQHPTSLLNDGNHLPQISKEVVVIDALLGTGINRAPDGIMAQLIDHINNSEAQIFSVDITSGLFTDTPTTSGAVICADHTITFQFPKLAFMMAENFKYLGQWQVTDINLCKDAINNLPSIYFYTKSHTIKSQLKVRKKDGHKGDYGRALIIAGRHGMMGACVLCAQACYRAGAGLVNAYIPAAGYHILQTAVPEALVVTDPSDDSITQLPPIDRYNAVAIGPGMSEGPDTADAFSTLLKTVKVPLVIDAGALNILAQNTELLNLLPADAILTPHLVEFERLVGKQGNEYERLEAAKKFATSRKCILVLKGAHTAVVSPEGDVYFNSTGNPGMATGGSGDVLTGIITALLAQSYTPLNAAIIGVYIHGYAGDLAAEKFSQPSMIASDIIAGISGFYKDFTT